MDRLEGAQPHVEVNSVTRDTDLLDAPLIVPAESAANNINHIVDSDGNAVDLRYNYVIQMANGSELGMLIQEDESYIVQSPSNAGVVIEWRKDRNGRPGFGNWESGEVGYLRGAFIEKRSSKCIRMYMSYVEPRDGSSEAPVLRWTADAVDAMGVRAYKLFGHRVGLKAVYDQRTCGIRYHSEDGGHPRLFVDISGWEVPLLCKFVRTETLWDY